MSTDIIKLDEKLLALLGTGGTNSLGLPKREIFLLDIIIAGTTHCDKIYDVESHLESGTILRMIRKPMNRHDQQAIAIFYDQTRIGYVPRELNLIISRLMDAGKEFYAKVDNVEDINTWVKISAKIYMIE